MAILRKSPEEILSSVRSGAHIQLLWCSRKKYQRAGPCSLTLQTAGSPGFGALTTHCLWSYLHSCTRCAGPALPHVSLPTSSVSLRLLTLALIGWNLRAEVHRSASAAWPIPAYCSSTLARQPTSSCTHRTTSPPSGPLFQSLCSGQCWSSERWQPLWPLRCGYTTL